MAATVKMYDSTSPGDIPPDAQAVLGYVDGSESAWAADAWARFEGRIPVIHLSTDASTDAGDGFDAENGNVGGSNSPAIRTKVQRLIDKGVERPWVYCQRSWWLGVYQALGPLATRVRWLIADWTGQPHLIAAGDYIGSGHNAPCDADGVQFTSPSTGSGGHYDVSVVRASAFGITNSEPEPAPPVMGAPLGGPNGVNLVPYRMQVKMGGGDGWVPLPDGVDPPMVVNVIVDDQMPDAPGVGYRPYPLWVGLATGPNQHEERPELVFESGAKGPVPDGLYGFTLIVGTP